MLRKKERTVSTIRFFLFQRAQFCTQSHEYKSSSFANALFQRANQHFPQFKQLKTSSSKKFSPLFPHIKLGTLLFSSPARGVLEFYDLKGKTDNNVPVPFGLFCLNAIYIMLTSTTLLVILNLAITNSSPTRLTNANFSMNVFIQHFKSLLNVITIKYHT